MCNIYWPNFPLETFHPNYVLITKVLDTNKYLIPLGLNIAKCHLEKEFDIFSNTLLLILLVPRFYWKKAFRKKLL